MSDRFEKGISALTDALQELKTLDVQVAGRKADIQRLTANATELRESNQKSADALNALNVKIAALRKEADGILGDARTEANKVLNDAKAEATAALLKREKEGKELREKLRAIVG